MFPACPSTSATRRCAAFIRTSRSFRLVRSKLEQRVEGYRFALERLVIMTPSSEAVEVERSLNHLQEQIAYYRTHLPPTWVREQSLSAQRY